jgi:peroxin-1
MPSKRRLAPVVNRDGISGTRGSSVREQEIATIEIDTTFGKVLGLAEGAKVYTAQVFSATS